MEKPLELTVPFTLTASPSATIRECTIPLAIALNRSWKAAVQDGDRTVVNEVLIPKIDTFRLRREGLTCGSKTEITPHNFSLC
ncbi:hypothetical protein [Methylobacterium flocculans]|uniref:hypothetical protein n=1 Tax=Methylobacterium flocculans TaxID=2984843 RepID=UPI0021F3A767|nr:hypothetical protein [Methylobacterium sp. FF17]